MDKISRSPLPDETPEEQMALQRVRCNMSAQPEDLVIAATQIFHTPPPMYRTVEMDRAARAGADVRGEALQTIPLSHWKRVLLALCAVSYGATGSSVTSLIRLCHGSKRLGEAVRTVDGFYLADPTLEYVDRRVVGVLRALFDKEFFSQRVLQLQTIANLCGLAASLRTYEYMPAEEDGLWCGGHILVEQVVELEQLLTCGSAHLNASAAHDVLRFLASVLLFGTSVQSLPIFLPQEVTRHSLQLCVEKELCFNRGFLFHGTLEFWGMQDFTLNWSCPFNGIPRGVAGFLAVFSFDPSGNVLQNVRVDWNTGVGQPAPSLPIEDLLVVPGCTQFSVRNLYVL